MYFEMDCPCKGKNLDKLMQPAILNILYHKAMHGTEIVIQLSKSPLFRGTYPDKAGVYRYLKKMEASGLLFSELITDEKNTRPVRKYSITSKGKACQINWYYALKEYAWSIEELANQIGNSMGI